MAGEMGRSGDSGDNPWFELAHQRAVELGVQSAVGATAIAIMNHASAWADRKLSEERTYDGFKDLVEYLESGRPGVRHTVLRQTAATALINYRGIDPYAMKLRLYPTNEPRRGLIGNALLRLTQAKAIERTSTDSTQKDLVRPTTSFIQAVTADLNRCQQLVGEMHDLEPDFDFAELRASVPEELRPEALPHDWLESE